MSGTITLTPDQQATLHNATTLRSAGFHEAAKHLEDTVWDTAFPARWQDDPSTAGASCWAETLRIAQEARQKGWAL